MKSLTLRDLKIRTQVSPQTAELRIELRKEALSRLGLGDPVEGSGRLRGPFCLRSQTLAANYPVRPAPEKGYSVIIPDSCYWTPDLPFTYELSLDFRWGELGSASLQASIALPSISLFQGRIYRSGKRWLPRIAQLSTPTIEDAGLWRDWLESVHLQDLAILLPEKDATDFAVSQCQSMGVPVAIETACPTDDDLAKWESCGAVFLLFVDSSTSIDSPLLSAKPMSTSIEEIRFWELSKSTSPSPAVRESVIASRRGGFRIPSEARKACDLLQADTAVSGLGAGYLV